MLSLLLGRRPVFLLLLVAAVLGPYVWNQPAWRTKLAAWWQTWAGQAEASVAAWTSSSGDSPPLPASDNPTAPPQLVSLPTADDLPELMVGPRVEDFGEVFRFDLPPRWVVSRWSRVTTILAEYDLEGLRVPFVSGTDLDDIAGSLTYYYDKQHQLQRISFEGRTGDERRLVQFMQQAFNLKVEPSHYAGLLLEKWNGQPKSVLLIRHAPVVLSAEPHSRLEITLELNRPNNTYRLSLPLQEELNLGRKAWRWGT